MDDHARELFGLAHPIFDLRLGGHLSHEVFFLVGLGHRRGEIFWFALRELGDGVHTSVL